MIALRWQGESQHVYGRSAAPWRCTPWMILGSAGRIWEAAVTEAIRWHDPGCVFDAFASPGPERNFSALSDVQLDTTCQLHQSHCWRTEIPSWILTFLMHFESLWFYFWNLRCFNNWRSRSCLIIVSSSFFHLTMLHCSHWLHPNPSRAQMFPADFGHLCERLRRAQGRGPSGEKDARGRESGALRHGRFRMFRVTYGRYMMLCMYIYILCESIYLSIDLSIYRWIYLSIHLSIYLSNRVCVCVFMHI